MCIIGCLSTIVFILPWHLDYTKVIILILWWRNFQLEYWRTFQLVSTHMELKNASNVPFSVDFVTFKVVDKKVAKRTAIQEQVIVPLRAFNYVTAVDGKSKERTVFTLPKFTLPDDKQLVVEMNEQNGGRHQRFILTNAELIRARVINELKVK